MEIELPQSRKKMWILVVSALITVLLSAKSIDEKGWEKISFLYMAKTEITLNDIRVMNTGLVLSS